MHEISRRTLLFAGTALVLPFASGGAVARASVPATAAKAALPKPLTQRLGDIVLTATAVTATDSELIVISATNTGQTEQTITVGYTNLSNKKASKRHKVTLPAGVTRSKYLYGHLRHTFNVEVCQVGAGCVTLGPIGSGKGRGA